MGLSPAAWQGRQVLLTGHTGFKGSWLAQWLNLLGAEVHGFALPPVTTPNLYALTGEAASFASSTLADIADAARLTQVVTDLRPELVIHLAAQPLVRQSYRTPVETWATNVMGTVNLLEAVRNTPGVAGVLVVTTDKCYENREWAWGYREIEPLGGHDPYSASKAGAELVTQSYRNSFFSQSSTLLASARAGNVIGGGDWSDDRLLPDAVRAIAAGQPLRIRSPRATRPWQHVLDCLSGYLLLAEHLLAGERSAARAFNFGPTAAGNLCVSQVLEKFQSHWPAFSWEIEAPTAATPHEANFLYLDSSLAQQQLGWQPKWSVDTALEKTADWYRAQMTGTTPALQLMRDQISEYMQP